MRAETEYNFKNSVVLFTHKKGYFNECIRTSAKNCGFNLCVLSNIRELLLFISRGSFIALVIDNDTITCNDSVLELFTQQGYYVPNIVVVHNDRPANICANGDNLFCVHYLEVANCFQKIVNRTLMSITNVEFKTNETFVVSNIREYLLNIGISSKYLGFEYIVEIQKILLMDCKMMKSLSKCVYPMVASKFYTTEASIEKNIRHLLKCGWSTSTRFKEMFSKIFDDAPTNRDFLCALAQNLKFLVE
ncbi:MAG: sporulation initiation factor Spo0A C-terminal domain-containing protein [Clostridia bacterium]|nr:sporulation initiation factor Spo0A C-terminal domain-containing protein [Clostridia bacterium]